MDLEKLIKVYDNKVPIQTIANIIKFSNRQHEKNLFLNASVGGDESGARVDKKVRDVQNLPMGNLGESLTLVHWNNLLHWMITRSILKYATDFKEFEIGLNGNIDNVQLLRYGVNQHYKWHVDDGVGLFRRLSFVMMLNNDFEGGELEFRFGEKITKIDVKVGRIIIWPSNFLFPHRVKPITKGIKHTIVCWGN